MPGQRIKDRAAQAEAAYLRRRGLDEDGNPLGAKPEETEEPEEQEDRYSQEETETPDTDNDPSYEAEDDGDTLDQTPPANESSDAEELRVKLAQAEHQIKSLMGRVPMTQQQLSQERSTNAALQEKLNQLEARLAEVQARENQVSVAEAIRGSLTDDDLAILGEEGAAAIGKAVQAATSVLMPSINPRDEVEAILRERDTQTVDQYRREVVREDKWLSKLGEFANDSAFNDWLEENPEVDSALRDLSSTQDKTRISRLSKNISRRIAEYHGESATPETTPEPKAAPKKTSSVPNPAISRARHMQRAPREQLTAQEAQERLAEAKRLSRTGRAADRKRAEELINSI